MRTISDLSVWAFVWLSVGCAGQDMESRLEQSEDPPATGGVVADLFELRWELEGNQTLVLAIETDLPEDAEVLVSVSRTYYTLGDTEAYSQEYYSERGTVRHWQQPRRIALDAERWKDDLREHQDMLASISRDMAIEIERISDSVKVWAVLHANQQGPRFGGRGNPLLSGKAVTSRSATFNIIEREEVFHLPLVGSPPPRKSRRAPWDGLESEQRYELTRETPLMASRERKEGTELDFLRSMRYLPAGTVILVTDVDRSESTPWYEVTLDGDRSVTGWINSIALMSQDITVRDGGAPRAEPKPEAVSEVGGAPLVNLDSDPWLGIWLDLACTQEFAGAFEALIAQGLVSTSGLARIQTPPHGQPGHHHMPGLDSLPPGMTVDIAVLDALPDWETGILGLATARACYLQTSPAVLIGDTDARRRARVDNSLKVHER